MEASSHGSTEMVNSQGIRMNDRGRIVTSIVWMMSLSPGAGRIHLQATLTHLIFKMTIGFNNCLMAMAFRGLGSRFLATVRSSPLDAAGLEGRLVAKCLGVFLVKALPTGVSTVGRLTDETPSRSISRFLSRMVTARCFCTRFCARLCWEISESRCALYVSCN